MDYIEIKLPKCTVFLTHKEIGGLLTKDTQIMEEATERGFVTAEEINKLLQRDIRLFSEVLKRGKGILRYRGQKGQERAKWEREKGNDLLH